MSMVSSLKVAGDKSRLWAGENFKTNGVAARSDVTDIKIEIVNDKQKFQTNDNVES
jgi:hypothetical protein